MGDEKPRWWCAAADDEDDGLPVAHEGDNDESDSSSSHTRASHAASLEGRRSE